MKKQPYYITTAILYTSGKPHIGNIYEIILADTLARAKKQQGYDVRFQTGTDEHGLKIAQNAAKAGVTPQEFCDKISGEIKEIMKAVNIDYDHFQRTTDPEHERVVTDIFQKMYDKGDIYLDEYEGWYCIPCESFFTDSQLDEEGHCPDCGRPVQKEKESSYFFRLSKYTQKLIDYYNEHPEFLLPVSRKNEMLKNFLEPGLNDLAVSRKAFDWGVKTFDPDHVIYVWLDALFNYLTGLGYEVNGDSDPLVEKYWPADVHVIGKDIVRFHSIYWPAFLMSMDLPLPKQIYGHPWLLFGDGSKMSKSKGNVLYADHLVHVFGTDAVRYLILREIPFDRDGHASKETLTERYNTDLANIFGNLFKRSLSMLQQYLDGNVAEGLSMDEREQEIAEWQKTLAQEFTEKVNTYHLQDALTKLWDFLRRLNKYIDETEPWVLAKDESQKERLERVLFTLLSGLKTAAILLIPFMPDTATAMLDTMEVEDRSLDNAADPTELLGKQLQKAPPTLFPRMKQHEVDQKFKEIEG